MRNSINAYLYGCQKHHNGIHHGICECYNSKDSKGFSRIDSYKDAINICINTTCNTYKATTVNLQIVLDIYKWSNKLMFSAPKWNSLIINISTNG